MRQPNSDEHLYAEERERVYREIWGEPERVDHEIVPRSPHIDVYVYPPGHQGRDFYTLVTGGMSDKPLSLPAPHGPIRTELVMYVSKPKEDYVDLLRTLARIPHDAGSFLWYGHTIPNGDPPAPFFPRSQLSVAFLTESIVSPDAEIGEHLQIEGTPLDLLWLIPITDAECRLKIEQGTGALLEKFNEASLHHVLHERRKSTV